MKSLNFKSAMMAAVLVCSLSSFKSPDTAKEATLNGCGSIVIDDDIMLAETEDPGDSIEFLVIESDNGHIFTFGGSGTNISSADISKLPGGHHYDASAVTAGCSINAHFYKK